MVYPRIFAFYSTRAVSAWRPWRPGTQRYSTDSEQNILYTYPHIYPLELYSNTYRLYPFCSTSIRGDARPWGAHRPHIHVINVALVHTGFHRSIRHTPYTFPLYPWYFNYTPDRTLGAPSSRRVAPTKLGSTSTEFNKVAPYHNWLRRLRLSGRFHTDFGFRISLYTDFAP